MNAVSACGDTPLYYTGNPDIYKLLLDRGATLLIQNNVGDTPLHYAVKSGTLQCCELLIEFAGFQLAGIENKKGQKSIKICQLSLNL